MSGPWLNAASRIPVLLFKKGRGVDLVAENRYLALRAVIRGGDSTAKTLSRYLQQPMTVHVTQTDDGLRLSCDPHHKPMIANFSDSMVNEGI